uniref:Uridine diphosphate glucose pyrophosphatase NUDT14 n=1 Tax=Strigamia maritima TaxID=126957 RepID=T1JH04_STRMM
MDKINNVTFSTYTESKYVQPFRMFYTQDGVDKTWDLVGVHQSVCIIIYNVTRKTLVFVRQFRPAVYYGSIPPDERHSDKIDTDKYPGKLGLTLELCAGVVDKAKSLEEIAQEEVLEECGYKVPIENLQRVKTYRSGVGVSGESLTMFYAQVDDDMKVAKGGGLESEGELIEVVEMSIAQVLEYLDQDEVQSPSGFLFAVMWFLQNKEKIIN